MARPTTIRREQILEAARALFLEQGLSVATATVARAAGVSEGTIFKRFGTKERLFLEAMCPRELDLGLEAEIGRGDPRETLVLAGTRLIGFYRELIPQMMRLWAHTGPDETPLDLMRRHGTPPPIRLVQTVTRYLAAEREAGRIVAEDPELVARAFVATMHNAAFFEQLGAPAMAPEADASYAAAVVDMLWRGIRPEEDDE